jgi:hypothetical protein
MRLQDPGTLAGIVTTAGRQVTEWSRTPSNFARRHAHCTRLVQSRDKRKSPNVPPNKQLTGCSLIPDTGGRLRAQPDGDRLHNAAGGCLKEIL